MKAKARPSGGRFAYEGLDRVIHERARLSVLTSLVTNPKGLAFGDLKQLCALTDGNLNRHLRVLEKGKMVEIIEKHDRNRASGSGCGKSNRRTARDRLGARSGAIAGLNFFLRVNFAVQS